jgi:hypothetical protein
MVRRLLPLILILLAGCASAPPFLSPAQPVEVQIPLDRPVDCMSTPPARPALPISALGTGVSPADTIRSYAATVVILKGAVRDGDALIAGCAALPAAAQAAAVGLAPTLK